MNALRQDMLRFLRQQAEALETDAKAEEFTGFNQELRDIGNEKSAEEWTEI